MGVAVSINGVACDDDPKVSIFDRGFLFGDSVFEVMRTYRRVPFGEQEHLERLNRSARGMGFSVPVAIGELSREIRDAIVRSGEPECYIRVIVTRGSGALSIDSRGVTSPVRVVIAAPLAKIDDALYERGVEIATVRVQRATDHTSAAGAKVSAYVANLLALRTAHERGGYEAMMVADDGSISEGNSSNLFIVRSGRLETPPVSSGILPGITRANVLAAASDLGVPTGETILFASDVERADEAFLTSSLREVVPIVAIDGKSLANGRPGVLTQRLHARYRERIAG